MPSLSREDVKILVDTVEQYIDNISEQTVGSRWRDICELGWLGLTVGAEDGGLDGGAAGLAAVMRGAGRGLITEPLLTTGVLCATLIERAGSAAQRAAMLAGIIGGKLKLALADGEPDGGHDRNWRNMRAEVTPLGYSLSGRKQFVADFNSADKLLVSARIEGGELALFLLDKNVSGVEAIIYPAVDGRLVADLSFEEVQLTAAARLPGDAGAALDAAYNLATIGICAEALGIMAALNAMTLDYIKTRRQFGVALGEFQVLQHRMVDMTVSEMEVTALLEQAVALHDSGHPDAPIWISAVKAMAGASGRAIAENAVQMHGGMGMSDDLKVGHYLKRLLVIGSSLGDAAWHMEQIAPA